MLETSSTNTIEYAYMSRLKPKKKTGRYFVVLSPSQWANTELRKAFENDPTVYKVVKNKKVPGNDKSRNNPRD